MGTGCSKPARSTPSREATRSQPASGLACDGDSNRLGQACSPRQLAAAAALCSDGAGCAGGATRPRQREGVEQAG